MATMATFATVASLAGTAVSAIGTIAAGRAEQKAANYEAAGLDIQAKEEAAAGQREAMETQRRKRLAISQLTARAAGSGFMATDPTVLDLAEDLGEYGQYQSELIQYGASSRAQGLKESAGARRTAGKAAMRGAYFSAAGTILSGIAGAAGGSSGGGSMFSRYGGGGYTPTARTGINRGYG